MNEDSLWSVWSAGEDPDQLVEIVRITPSGQVMSPLLDVLKQKEHELERLRRKLAYYEAPLPMGKGNCYHRFTDEGLCIRCGEDAEEWDAGCVEEMVEELQSVTTREFADVLGRLIRRRYTAEHAEIAKIYLERIEKFAAQWELIESWKERPDVDARIDIPDTRDADDFSLTL